MRYPNKLLLLGAATLLLLASSALAGEGVTLSYSTGNNAYFNFAVSDDWKVNVGFEIDPSVMPEGETPKPRLISAMPNAGGQLWFAMWVPEKVKNIEEAKEYLADFRGYLVENAVTKEIKEMQLNGMQAVTAVGEGERDGKTVDVVVVLFQLSSENVGVVIYIGTPESTKQHGADLKYMVESIHSLSQ